MKSCAQIDHMIGTCGTSPDVENINRILEVCQALNEKVRRLERLVENRVKADDNQP